MRKEMDNLTVHDAYDELPEDSLPSWSASKRRASEVVNTLWTLRRKRDADNRIEKYKGRCVYDGRNQKEVARLEGRKLNCYAPCGRPATNKAQMATAVAGRRRARTFDVEAAYLKGVFEEGEIIYARPPPGYRKYDTRGVAIVWRLKVPLHGKAGRRGVHLESYPRRAARRQPGVHPVRVRPVLLLQDSRRRHSPGHRDLRRRRVRHR
jgi:hypothetical protein